MRKFYTSYDKNALSQRINLMIQPEQILIGTKGDY